MNTAADKYDFTSRDADNSDTVSAAEIMKYSENGIFPSVYDELPSTNSFARELAEKGAPEGTLIVSSSQTEGRGKIGRKFFSPGKSGIYLSLILRPDLPLSKALGLTTAAAVAICRALDKEGADGIGIKWVNDIFKNGKKVAGILTESSVSPDSGKILYSVLGIGINLYKPENGFPEDIEKTAGYIFDRSDKSLKNRIVANTVGEFMKIYKAGLGNGHMDEYRKRCVFIGKEIDIIGENTVHRATALGISDDGNLSVRYENGEEGILFSGDISIRSV